MLLVELLPAVAGPVAPVLPDWVTPVVLAFPDSAPEVEFDVVFTEPDWPPLPELPEVATGLAVALPVSVEPVEPVFPEVAAAFPSQVPTIVTHGATVIADPEFPESPEFPELPDVASPLELADPVSPELALPDEAVVSFSLVDVADPEVPPVVVPVAVELPLEPDVAVAVEPSEAFPVLPELAVPLALPDWDDPEPLGPGPPWPLPLPLHLLPEPLFEPVFADPDFGLA